MQEIRAQEDSKNVAPPLKPIHDRLTGIRAELEGLALTHRWTLRETDLWNYSLSLQEVDKMRIDGKFVDSEGNKPAGQYVCLILHILTHLGVDCLTKVLLYLLRRCYGVIYRLLSSSEPVSEELMPIVTILVGVPAFTDSLAYLQANKLSTVKKCLNEVLKYGGPFNARDLYPVRVTHIHSGLILCRRAYTSAWTSPSSVCERSELRL